MAFVTLDGGIVVVTPTGAVGDGFIWTQATIVTTNDTPRNVTELQRVITDGANFVGEMHVQARRSNGVAKLLTPKCMGRRLAGVTEIIGQEPGNEEAFSDPDAVLWTVEFEVSSNMIYPKLTGEAGVTIGWDILMGIRLA